MNKARKFQSVPQSIEDKAAAFADALIKSYERGGSPQSRAVTGRWGAEKDPKRQTYAKVGEAAVAIYFGLDPIVAVKWDSGNPDKGGDVRLPSGSIVDVKTTLPPFKLIWSKEVNDFYWDKKFDHLISVSVDEHDYKRCWIEGYVSKQRFWKDKKIADGKIIRLDAGTWYMDKRDLSDIDELKLVKKPENVAQSTWDAFLYVRKHAKESLSAWLDLHPEVPR